MKHATHSRYIPPNAQAIEHPAGIVYAYTTNGRPHAVAYRGQRSQADWHYSFQSEERREEQIRSFFAALDARAKAKADRTAERQQPHTLEPGNVIYNAWGYDQTNIDFYEITKCSAHFVWLQRLSSHTTETGFMQGHAVPAIGTRSGQVTHHRVYRFHENNSVHFEFGSGTLWDGKPKFCSWYA